MQQEFGKEVPEKYFPKWLQTESRIAELKMWIGLIKFVLALGTIAGLTIYIGNRFPEALRYLPPVVAGICSLAGIAIGIDKHKNRSRDD